MKASARVSLNARPFIQVEYQNVASERGDAAARASTSAAARCGYGVLNR